MNNIYRFSIDFGWAEADKSWPIYDENDALVGGFTVGEFGELACFVSGIGFPICLKISSGDSFFATPITGKHGQTEKIIVSEHKLNSRSVQVTAGET